MTLRRHRGRGGDVSFMHLSVEMCTFNSFSPQEVVSAAVGLLQLCCHGDRGRESLVEKIFSPTFPLGNEDEQRQVWKLHLQKSERTHR